MINSCGFDLRPDLLQSVGSEFDLRFEMNPVFAEYNIILIDYDWVQHEVCLSLGAVRKTKKNTSRPFCSFVTDDLFACCDIANKPTKR